LKAVEEEEKEEEKEERKMMRMRRRRSRSSRRRRRTHSLKAHGFNPCRAYEVKNQFQTFAFKCHLHPATHRGE
jgi:hypothetical protein